MQNGGTDLLSAKIEIEGKGIGTVVDVQKSAGKPTEHIIAFDSGTREAVRTPLLDQDFD